jgi:hypothetical protein
MSTLQVSQVPAIHDDRKVRKSRRRFLKFFPDGFADDTYREWERNYKWEAHNRFEELLGPDTFRNLLRTGEYVEVANRAVRVESRTNLLFSFEKMALRDAVKSDAGAKIFARALFELVHGAGRDAREQFERWIDAIAQLPRRQTRVLTWPVVTVFPFLAVPDRHIFLKPTTVKKAAERWGFDFRYHSRPNWGTYANYLDFAATIRHAIRDLKPKDMIDIQSFIWAIGSDEYDNM